MGPTGYGKPCWSDGAADGAGVQLEVEPPHRYARDRGHCGVTSMLAAIQLQLEEAVAVHRCRLVRNYLASLHGGIAIAQLPPCAPELNPVEYIRGYWKQHELPNLCPSDYAQLSAIGHRTLARMRRRPRLIAAF